MVAMTIITTEVKYSGSSKPACKPVDAIIRATSPLDIIPDPIPIAAFRLKPVNRAPNVAPINFVRIATTVRKTRNTSWSPTPSKVTLSPMLTKKTGTNME
ncbi:hypothetical protein D3C71_1735090 [compost metagenome]